LAAAARGDASWDGAAVGAQHGARDVGRCQLPPFDAEFELAATRIDAVEPDGADRGAAQTDRDIAGGDDGECEGPVPRRDRHPFRTCAVRPPDVDVRHRLAVLVANPPLHGEVAHDLEVAPRDLARGDLHAASHFARGPELRADLDLA